ncbi:hypothetical protein ACLOJK_030589 [Asimina triloba]
MNDRWELCYCENRTVRISKEDDGTTAPARIGQQIDDEDDKRKTTMGRRQRQRGGLGLCRRWRGEKKEDAAAIRRGEKKKEEAAAIRRGEKKKKEGRCGCEGGR